MMRQKEIDDRIECFSTHAVFFKQDLVARTFNDLGFASLTGMPRRRHGGTKRSCERLSTTLSSLACSSSSGVVILST